MLRFRTPARWRPGLILLLLWLGVIAYDAPSVEAAVAPRPPEIVLSYSADFPEIVFALYRTKADNPWATGTRVDPAGPTIVPAGTAVELPFWQEFAVLAVPRPLVDRAKGAADPAWLDPSAPGVVRVPGTFQVPSVFRGVVLRYQLEKANEGPKLTLLNPEDLKAARQQPVDTSAEVPKSQPFFLTQPLFLWGLVAGGCLGLVVGLCFSWQLKRRNLPPARDSVS